MKIQSVLILTPLCTNGFQTSITMYASSPISSSSSSRSTIMDGKSTFLCMGEIPKSKKILQQEHELLERRTNALINMPSPLPPEFYSEAKHVIYAWSKSPEIQRSFPDEPAKCAISIEMLLRRMIEEQTIFLEHVNQSQILKDNRLGLRNKEEDILMPKLFNDKDHEKRRKMQGNIEYSSEIGVNVCMYNALILAWAESGFGDEAFERCQEILESMHFLYISEEARQAQEQKFGSTGRVTVNGKRSPKLFFANIKPNLNTVRNALYAAALATTEPGLKAESILEYVTTEGILYPNVDCWNIVLYAWSRFAKTQVGSAQRAQQILEWMSAMSSCNGNQTSIASDMTDKNDRIRRRLQPNIQSYRNVVRAWASSEDSDGGDKAEEIAWEGYNKFNQTWDMSTWISVLKAHATRGDGDKAGVILSLCRLNAEEEADVPFFCYIWVLNAYANNANKSVESAMKAEELLMEIMELEDVTDGKIRPNTFCFNIVMHAWCRTRIEDAAKHTELIFNHMQRLYNKELEESEPIESLVGEGNKNRCRPDSMSYHILIKAWSWTRGCKGVAQAEKYLNEMEHLYFNKNDKRMKPNVRTYTLVMNAWSRCPQEENQNGALRAEMILERMENMYRKGRIPTLKPDKQCYKSVLNAWSRSRQPNKAFKARELLDKMDDLYQAGNKELKPDLFLYNTVMNIAAFTPYEASVPELQRDALDITYETFMQLQRKSKEYDLAADSVIYSTFLKACRKLMPPDESRNSVIKAVFGKCCREGYVSRVVIRELKRCCGNDISGLWSSLILKNTVRNQENKNDFPDVNDLPSEWSRSVKSLQQKKVASVN